MDEYYCDSCGVLLFWGAGDFNCTHIVCPSCYALRKEEIETIPLAEAIPPLAG
jgi:uncharacterized Zn finger protein (UPF0148 family)